MFNIVKLFTLLTFVYYLIDVYSINIQESIFLLFVPQIKLDRKNIYLIFDNNKIGKIMIPLLIINIYYILTKYFSLEFLADQEVTIYVDSEFGDYEFTFKIKKEIDKKEFINQLVAWVKNQNDDDLHKSGAIYHIQVTLKNKFSFSDKIFFPLFQIMDKIPSWVLILILMMILLIFFNANHTDLAMAAISYKKFNLKRGIDKISFADNLRKFFKQSKFKSNYIKLLIKLGQGYKIITLGKGQPINLLDKSTLKNALKNITEKIYEYEGRYEISKLDSLYIYSIDLNSDQYNFLTKVKTSESNVNLTIQFPYREDYKILGRYEINSLGYDVFNIMIDSQEIQKLRIIKISDTQRIIQIYIGDKIYTFKEIINSINNTVTRNWENGTIEVIDLSTNLHETFVAKNDKMNLSKIKPGYDLNEIEEKSEKLLELNKNKQNKLNEISARFERNFLGITLDLETFYNQEITKNGSIGKLSLASLAWYHPTVGGKFYSMFNQLYSTNIVEKAILDIFEFIESTNGKLGNTVPIFIHNGKGFDFIFLIQDIVSFVLMNKNYSINPIVKDNSFIQIDITKIDKVKKTEMTISFRDSLLMLPKSLNELCKAFGLETHKTIFPYSYMDGKDKLKYEGPVPSIKFFNGLDIESYRKYCSQFKNWNLLNELKKYNINDCIALYQILDKFNSEIVNLFDLNINQSPSLPSLSYKIWRTKYMPINNKIIFNADGTITNKKLGTIDAFNLDLDSVVRDSYYGGHVDAYIPHFDNSLQQFEEQVIKQYDVVSLYPSCMNNYDFPTIFIGTYFGDITKTQYWENNVSFCQCEVIAPDIKNPILPYKKDGIVIYGYGSWSGTYYSAEIKNAMKFGYKFKINKSFIFEKSDLTFQKYIKDLFKIKKETPKSDPKYQIVKLLMNSLYGRTGIDLSNLFKYELVHNFELDNMDPLLIAEFLQVSESYSLVAKVNNPANLQGNVALASAVTAYGRIDMSVIKNNPNFNLYYTDTDSAFIDGELPANLVGKNLGQFALEQTFSKFIALGAKVYGGITLDGNEIIKAKGMIQKPNFNELELLLNEHHTVTTKAKKSYKNILDKINRIIWKEIPYLLAPNSNKRKLVYENGKLIGTKNIKI